MIRALLRRRVRAAGGGGGGSSTVANYAALPNAVLTQQPDWAFWIANVRDAAAGTAYVDPISGMRGVKLTSATVPSANAGIRMDYSSGGPFISAPWGTNGNSVTVWANGMGLCDITRGGVPTNYRNPVVAGGELTVGFSRNPATPRRAYVLSEGFVRRINTETNTVDAGQGFPYDLTAYINASFNHQWITVSDNDETIACCPANGALGPTHVMAIRTATQTVLVKTVAEVNARNGGLGINEQYTTADGRYVLIAQGSGISGMIVWDLVTNFMTAGFSAPGQAQLLSHSTTAGGSRFVSTDAYGTFQTANIFTAVPVTADGQAFPTVTSIIAPTVNSPAFGHNNSYQVGPATLADRYVVGQVLTGVDTNAETSTRGSWAIHSGQIYRAIVNADLPNRSDQRGVRHVFRRASNSITATIVATVRLATSIGDMTEDSWFWDQATRTMYLWRLGGGAPNAQDSAQLPNQGAPIYALSAIRADGANVKFLAHHYSTGIEYADSAFSQQSYDGKWVAFSTNHGVTAGRNDVLILELPVI